tara:strand:+ start:624 stop:1742 length:1119 start_codon:yes stop_codon:yes gene_type:complete
MKIIKQKKSFLKNVRPTINEIAKYVPGEYTANSKNKKVIKLSSNESPFEIPSGLKNLISNQLIYSFRYPDGDSNLLKEAIARKFSINKKQIVCGNGSDDILSLISQAFTPSGSEIICSKNGFIFYPVIAQAAGAKIVYADTINLNISLENILKKISKKTKVIFFANPNNPSGSLLFKKEIIRFLKKVPTDIIVVLDGAYAEYVTDEKYTDGIELVKSFKNLIITRTFSKIYALAGFRVGWAYSSLEIIEILEKIRGPFNVNLIAQIAAAKILHNRKFIQKSIDHNFTWRNWLQKELERLNLRTYNSFGNFLLVKNNSDYISTEKIVSELKKNNILVRFLKNYGLNNFFRVSIGLEVELKIFIRKLRIILRKN